MLTALQKNIVFFPGVTSVVTKAVPPPMPNWPGNNFDAEKWAARWAEPTLTMVLIEMGKDIFQFSQKRFRFLQKNFRVLQEMFRAFQERVSA